MAVIYEPTGKAREYSELACNLYTGCSNGCLYCYAPAIRRMKRDAYLNVTPRQNIVNLFHKELTKNDYGDKQILFCFMTDPYNSLESEKQITRRCIEIANDNNIRLKILTKNSLVLRDLDILKNHTVGFTLTFFNLNDSKYWEPNASNPTKRLNSLVILKAKNIKTWASFEPVIDPMQSFELIKETVNLVDHYKIGKLNNYKGLDKDIDWACFLDKCVNLLRRNGKSFYIKKDLREAAPVIELRQEEKIIV